ncbi:fumarylacetoacetate hydrolase family protein [Limoniibacter endophyticus]|uniref:Fumarylacetoacetate (FAA) hydrolase n=1 Tax=Limoniibacter endophyticus TaxID=1565040 RepID=A0A8J3DIT7_9HYPH|nr:fumarylacetoacetate hydrolase family protein [Limoniibacter endophyticus]GHC75765.1 fumarylacetoacetate (FAA) hydrolase [Limoniibacter endophyticus]
MPEYVIETPACPSVMIEGSDKRFPVRRVFCVGRNYADHAREMGSDPDREPPFFFSKPADAVVDSGSVIPHPPLTRDLQHEIELVVAIGTGGFDIDRERALDHVWGYGVGIDLTRRDLQTKAKKQGHPWDWAKGFDQSAPCGAIAPIKNGSHPSSGRIWLTVNDELRQDGDLADLIWPIPDIISICSQSVELRPGDLIYTGTPAGVTTLVPGDVVKGGVDGFSQIEITIGNAI